MTRTKLYFTTCTLPEAVEELNCQLRAASLHEITETDLTGQTKCDDTPDDWFEDYRFEFTTTFDMSAGKLVERLDESAIEYEIVQ